MPCFPPDFLEAIPDLDACAAAHLKGLRLFAADPQCVEVCPPL